MSKKIIGGLVIVAAVGAGGFLYNQKMNEANVKIEAALNEQISIIEEANPNFDVDYKDYKINIDKTVVVNGITLKMKDTMKTIPIGDLKIADFDYSSLKLIEPLRTLRYIHFTAWITKRWEDPSFKNAFPQFGTEAYWETQTADLREQLSLIQDSQTPEYY